MAGEAPARWKAVLVSAAILAASSYGIAAARPRLVATLAAVHVKTDIYALPPAEAMPAVSLGYNAALADLLFSATLVNVGMHGEEHRRFDDVANYLDAMIALDPTFREPYRFADALILFQPVGSPSDDDVHRARRIVEEGMRNRPDDGQLWMGAGQFMAFLATQFLSSEEEKAEYRSAGARALVHAGMLVGANQNIQWQALSAAGLLSREGERAAAIQFLERLRIVTDDPSLQADIDRKLAALQAESTAETAKRHGAAFNAAWHADMSYVSRSRMLVLGPGWDAARCAGALPSTGKECVTTWAGWSEARGER